ncbi:MAG: cell envelope integrity protein TolA [Chlorobiaceae bacterium]|nr:cell envelope integrity protein TolA [Chlorobiaceae bacterium]
MNKGLYPLRTDRKFYAWLIAAAVMHVLVICLSLFIWIWESGRHVKTRVVNVTFVSLPGSGGAAEVSEPGTAKTAEQSSPQEARAPALTQPAEQIAQVPQKKLPEEPLKSKPEAKPSDLARTLEKLKQSADRKTQASPSSLNSALSALRQKVSTQGASGGSGQGTGSGRGGSGFGFGNGGISDPYKAQLAMIIQNNWEFSKNMMRNSFGMEVYVRINILPDGTIREIVYDKRSPSEYLNMSVKHALEKSSPLPALPRGQGNPDLWVGFVFTPKGIEQ